MAKKVKEVTSLVQDNLQITAYRGIGLTLGVSVGVLIYYFAKVDWDVCLVIGYLVDYIANMVAYTVKQKGWLEKKSL